MSESEHWCGLHNYPYHPQPCVWWVRLKERAHTCMRVTVRPVYPQWTTFLMPLLKLICCAEDDYESLQLTPIDQWPESLQGFLDRATHQGCWSGQAERCESNIICGQAFTKWEMELQYTSKLSPTMDIGVGLYLVFIGESTSLLFV